MTAQQLARPDQPTTVERERATTPAWRRNPIRWVTLRALLIAYTLLTIVVVAVGLLLTHQLATRRLHRVDLGAARWFADQRTPRWNDLGQIGSALADAFTVTPAIVFLAVLFVVLFRRWNETLLLVTAILLEKAVFVTSTLLVGRERPPVGQLDGAPPTSSYPSGHVAAAVVFYTACAIVVGWHFRSEIIRALVWIFAITIPVLVALSRMLLGMHYLTDVVVGVMLGIVSVLIAGVVVRRSDRASPCSPSGHRPECGSSVLMPPVPPMQPNTIVEEGAA